MSQIKIEIIPKGILKFGSDDVKAIYTAFDFGGWGSSGIVSPAKYYLKLKDESISEISEKTYNKLREDLTISVWYIKKEFRVPSLSYKDSDDDTFIEKIHCIRETETQVYTTTGEWINKTDVFSNVMSLATRYGSMGHNEQRSVEETKRFLEIKGITDIKGLIKSIEAKLLTIPLIYMESNTYKTLVDTKKEELKLQRQLLELKTIIKSK